MSVSLTIHKVARAPPAQVFEITFQMDVKDDEFDRAGHAEFHEYMQVS